MSIRAMIAEDERLAREELAYLIQQEKDFILCPSAENGSQFLELYVQYRPDVLFLDINMPVLSGMEVAKELVKLGQDGKRPLIVFTTAYDEYAAQAFDLEAVDYLLKPYHAERFKDAISRVRKRLISMNLSEGHPPVAAERPLFSKGIKLLIEEGEKMVVVAANSVHYAVKTERSVEIYTDQGKIQTKMTLQELEDKVKGLAFFRPHRSYLVNLDYIEEITPWFNGAYNIKLKHKDETRIPVSRNAAKELFRLLSQ